MPPARSFGGGGNSRALGNYPEWLRVSKQLDLARTVVIGGVRNELQKPKVAEFLESLYGKGCVEYCTVIHAEGKLSLYTRFKNSVSPPRPGGESEDLSGNRTAFYAVFQLHGKDMKDLNLGLGGMLTVRPAVWNASLWVGDLSATIDDTGLKTIVEALKGDPVSAKVATSEFRQKRKGWGTVHFKTDEAAAAVLVKAWESLLISSEMPWPVHFEALAPAENTVSKFLLSLSSSHIDPPPHFVQSNTLEWEFGVAWRSLCITHKAQKNALGEEHWRERHLLMAKHDGDKDDQIRWQNGAKDCYGPVHRTRRTIFVQGIDESETKESVKAFFEDFGEVERVVLEQKAEMGASGRKEKSASVRFGSFEAVQKARKQVGVDPVQSIGKLVVRQQVDEGTIWIDEIGPQVTNRMLREAFEQFGQVKLATVAINRETNHPLGHGIVQYEKTAVASSVLDVMDSELFVMQGSSRPLHVEPQAIGEKKWSSKSPADTLMQSEAIELITKDHKLFDWVLDARALQVRQRAEVKQLRALQAKERGTLEQAQRDKLVEENRKFQALQARLKKLGDRPPPAPSQPAGKQHRERKRGFDVAAGPGGVEAVAQAAAGQRGQDASGASAAVRPELPPLWQGEIRFTLTPAQVKSFTGQVEREARNYIFPALCTGSEELQAINHRFPWREEQVALGVLKLDLAKHDIIKKRDLCHYMSITTNNAAAAGKSYTASQGLLALKHLLGRFNLAIILWENQHTVGRLYILDSDKDLPPEASLVSKEGLCGVLVKAVQFRSPSEPCA